MRACVCVCVCVLAVICGCVSFCSNALAILYFCFHLYFANSLSFSLAVIYICTDRRAFCPWYSSLQTIAHLAEHNLMRLV